MNLPIFQRPVARIALAGLILALLLFVFTPLGTTVAQSVIETIQSWQLGDSSTAVSVEGDFEAVAAEDGSTVVRPAPEEPPVLEEISEPNGEVMEPVAFDTAQGELPFTLRQPTFIPEGYRFNGVSLGEHQASVEYFSESGMGLFGLLQTAVGGEYGEVQVTFSSDSDVMDVTVNGQDGLWIASGEEGLLVWEADGVNYQLAGLGDMDLALQIAESIE